jgi:hypothetical protein
LAELATQAEPGNTTAHGVRADVYARRVTEEASTMAKGVFAWAASESRAASAPAAADEDTVIDG